MKPHDNVGTWRGSFNFAGRHRKNCRKFTGPILPSSFWQAMEWLRGRAKIQLGFVHQLRRNDAANLKVVEIVVEGKVVTPFYAIGA